MANSRSRRNNKEHQGGVFIMTPAKKKSKRRYLPFPYPAFTKYADNIAPEQIKNGFKIYWKQSVAIQQNRKFQRQSKGISYPYFIHPSIRQLEEKFL